MGKSYEKLVWGDLWKLWEKEGVVGNWRKLKIFKFISMGERAFIGKRDALDGER